MKTMRAMFYIKNLTIDMYTKCLEIWGESLLNTPYNMA